MNIAVIGRGMMGAAAARHLAKAGLHVTLIGPSEPSDKRHHHGVFASHYDEGRITRKCSLSPFWSEAAIASIARYPEIEAESGISFFSEVGGLMVGGPASASKLEATRAALDIPCQVLTDQELAHKFPFFAFPSGVTGFYEPEQAGYISPRALVAAQTKAAQHHGATVIDQPVEQVEDGRVITSAGSLEFDDVLVACGAMTDHVIGRPLRQKVYARTVAFFEVNEAEQGRLAKMPTLIRDIVDGSYLLPPIRYPDSKTYLKLGGESVDVELTIPSEIGDWFRSGGNADIRDQLASELREIMPGLTVEHVGMDACVTVFLEDDRPEIRRVNDRLVVCSGGCGAAAKSSDELGRRGASLILERQGVFA